MYSPVKDGILKTARSVSYVEAKPPPGLSNLVHCFWELKTVSPLQEDFCYHILPDACVNILFNQIDPKICAITSLHTTSKELNLGKLFHYVGIQMLPGVWRGSPDEVLDRYVDSPYEGNLSLVETSNEIATLDFFMKQIVLTKLVEQFCIERVVAPNDFTSKITSSMDEIHTVEDMATISNMSSRQLQRILKKTMGFAPHDFLKVLRLQQTFKQNYLDHYADQSHFIHSFRKITGYSPTKYTKKFDV